MYISTYKNIKLRVCWYLLKIVQIKLCCTLKIRLRRDHSTVLSGIDLSLPRWRQPSVIIFFLSPTRVEHLVLCKYFPSYIIIYYDNRGCMRTRMGCIWLQLLSDGMTEKKTKNISLGSVGGLPFHTYGNRLLDHLPSNFPGNNSSHAVNTN